MRGGKVEKVEKVEKRKKEKEILSDISWRSFHEVKLFKEMLFNY
jgi:hypothetical protein